MTEANLIIIGAGKMGKYHGEAALAIGKCNLVGITSRTLASAEKLAKHLKVPHFDNDLERLVKTTNANCCIIAVSHHKTAEITKQCLELGLHCLVEKPVALSPDKIKSLSNIAKEKGLKVMVAMNRRFYSTVQGAFMYGTYYGGFGAIHLTASDYPDFYRLKASMSPEVYDEWPIMNTIHGFDLLHFYGQGISKVVQTIKNNQNGIDKGRNIHALLEAKNGAILGFMYAESAGTMKSWKINLSGENYALELGPLEKLKVTFPVPGVIPIIENEASEFKPGISEQLSFFVDIILNSLDVTFPACSLEAHAEVVEAMKSVFEA